MQEPEVQLNNNEQQPEVQLTNIEDASEREQESDILDEDNDDENKAENFEGFNGSGRTVTLQMLLAANVLQPGKSTMTIEYLGQKFVGDLLTDGKIKSQETETIFLSPSAWAMHCKRIINPDKKSGCGWASVKYKGRKLDAYKATWMRKCALQKESTPSEEEPEMEADKKEDTPPPSIKRALVSHNVLMNRNIAHDANTLVEAVPFSFINKMQPFLVSVSASVLLLADFHCCLTKNEVCGYLGGLWDVNSYTLTITKAYPCCNTRLDREKAVEVELKIQKNMLKDQLLLVGWYHSHPKFQAQPTLRDIDAQLDYEIKLRGPSDVTYTPCVGFIFSPYYENNPTKETDFMSYWVIPPTENRQMLEYGRPMSMQYTVLAERIIPEHVKDEMQICVEYYSSFKNELIDFSSVYKDNLTYLEKLKTTLYTKFPEKQDDKEFWNWICKLLKCEGEDEFVVPKNVSKIIQKSELKEKSIDLKEDNKDEDTRQKTASELKIMSLQEQLCLPSGLNMNPSRLCSPLGSAAGSSASASASAINSIATATSSPRDSPITIPSNSASPAKFEVPVRASPSPAKSDTSSTRTRNSPAPSPGKFSISDISRNSPSVTPNKYEGNHTSSTTDFMAANLASLTGPNSFINDLNAFFQQQKDYGSSSLNQLAAAAAKAGGKTSASETFEKSNEIYSQQAFNFPGTSKSMDLHASTKVASKQETRNAKVTAGTSYKTKLMKELEDLKNDPIKISELMRSPEYAALLLQQAEALGATTLGTLGLGADFSFLGGNSSKKNFTDYSNLLQASKLLGYDTYMQQAKTGNDLNVFFQQQMGGTKKQQQQQTQPPDYTALLQSYSKLLETSNTYPSPKAPVSAELSALLNAGNNTSTKKKDTSEMLNQLLQTDKANDLNNILYHHQGKVQNDLNPLFVSPSAVTGSSKGSTDPSSYYTQLAQEKIQDYAALFQQHHGKYGIPDPLSKSTLAANNMFMPPSALLKLQQESLSAMMMKPPKSNNTVSSSVCSSRGRESSASPAHERLTPTKSGLRDNLTGSASGMKYNFSAVDLAISSVQGSSNATSSSSESGRRPTETPPVDLSRIYQELPLQTKKRMEFSSIADLAAPPSKVSKPNDREENALNLSSSD